MAFAAASERPIRGAVATLGVSDRVNFLRKTYGLLGLSLIVWPILTAALFKLAPGIGLKILSLGGGFSWLLVIGGFMAVGWVANKLATSDSSRAVQLAGLGLEVAAWSVMLQPILWILALKFGDRSAFTVEANGSPVLSGEATSILLQAVVITLSIFVGLTLTVFVTKKDFSFMRGILTIASFGALGIVLASILFGFSLGALFCGFMVLLMGGYILYQTSTLMSQWPPTAYVAAALMLFSTVATLFWYVIQLLMSRRS